MGEASAGFGNGARWLRAPAGLSALRWLLTAFGGAALLVLLALAVLTISTWGQPRAKGGGVSRVVETRAAGAEGRGGAAAVAGAVAPVAPVAAVAPAGGVAGRDSAKEAKDEIREAEARHDSLFRWILTLVGLYTIFIGTFTLVAGLFSYVNVEALKERTNDQADELRRSSDALQEEIRDQLPEVSNLKTRLYELLMELDQLIPGEEDWAGGPEASPALRQRVLISEQTVNGLRIFLNPAAAETRQVMLRLYRKLALFYFREAVRLRSDDAVERADFYVELALELDPRVAELYRIRGAIALSRYSDLTVEGGVGGDESARFEARHLLERALSNLKTALRLDEGSLGAGYNLALAYFYDRRIAPAIDVSMAAMRELRARFRGSPGAVPVGDVRKYVPFLYVNAVCFVAERALAETGAVREASLADALGILQEGVALLNTREFRVALAALRSGIEDEMERGDLTETPAEFRGRVGEIFMDASRAAASVPSAGETAAGGPGAGLAD